MASKLEPRPEIPNNGTRYHMIFGTDEHYVLVSRFVGFPDPKDNGYIARLIRRKDCTPEQAKTLLHAYTERGATGPSYFNIVETRGTEKQ